MEKFVEIVRAVSQKPLIGAAKIEKIVNQHEKGTKLFVKQSLKYMNLRTMTNSASTQKILVNFKKKIGGDATLQTCYFDAEPCGATKTLHAHCPVDAPETSCDVIGQFEVEHKSGKKAGGGEPSLTVSVWRREFDTPRAKKTLEKIINVAHQDVHGKTLHNELFSTFNLSYSGQKLVYIAESKPAKSNSFFKSTKSQSEEEIESGESSSEFEYKASFGEQLEEIVDPVVCVLDLSSERIQVIRIDKLVCGGGHFDASEYRAVQACFTPDDSGLVVLAYKKAPFNLGPIYCVQRPMSLFYVPFSAAAAQSEDAKQTEQETNKETTAAGFAAADKLHLLTSLDKAVVATSRISFSPTKVASPSSTSSAAPSFVLAWFESRVGGAHGQCLRLMTLEWTSKFLENLETFSPSSKCLIDFVDAPIDPSASQHEFPGIYSPTHLFWKRDSSGLVFDSLENFRTALYSVPLFNASNDVTALPAAPLPGLDARLISMQLLHVRQDFLLAAASSNTCAPQLALLNLQSASSSSCAADWKFLIEGGDDADDVIECLGSCQLVQHEANRPLPPTCVASCHEARLQKFSSLLTLPLAGMEQQQKEKEKNEQREKRPPLIALLHGGPHTAFCSTYTRTLEILLRCGFAVLQTNYRGSLGRGQAFVDVLRGRIGQLEIDDVIQAIEETTCGGGGKVDAHNVFAWGGSHGGFMGAHLALKDLVIASSSTSSEGGGGKGVEFRAIVLRNPVINLTSMLGTTDIPDWVVEETRSDADDAAIAWPYENASQLSFPSDGRLHDKLWRASPIRKLFEADATHKKGGKVAERVPPVLLTVGEKDRRVPPSQGIELYRHLRSHGVACRLLAYPDDCHPLSTPACFSDCMVNILMWFEQNKRADSV